MHCWTRFIRCRHSARCATGFVSLQSGAGAGCSAANATPRAAAPRRSAPHQPVRRRAGLTPPLAAYISRLASPRTRSQLTRTSITTSTQIGIVASCAATK